MQRHNEYEINLKTMKLQQEDSEAGIQMELLSL
jgi:hypothetical protein